MNNVIYHLFEKLSKGVSAANDALVAANPDLNLSGSVIDEVALIFWNEREAWKFIEQAVRVPGVKLFNAAHDNVRTYPIRSEYGVEYYFLETTWGYRVECMIVTSGFSPLHGGVQTTYYDAADNKLESGIVHYSFRCDNEAEYEEVCRMMQGSGMVRSLNCDSTYGQFSYWMTNERIDEEMAELGVDWCLSDNPLEAYLKPRVNLRDAGNEIRPEVVAKRKELEGDDAVRSEYLTGMSSEYLGSKA